MAKKSVMAGKKEIFSKKSYFLLANIEDTGIFRVPNYGKSKLDRTK